MRRLVRSTGWIEGVGLHCGRKTAARISPHLGGLVFRAENRELAVSPFNVLHTKRHTVLVGDGTHVATVEHVLSALVGLGIFECVVEVTGGELPALDGSAAPFVSALLSASEPIQSPAISNGWLVTRELSVHQGNSCCMLRPANHLHIRCEIDFSHRLVGSQRLSFDHDEQPFIDEIAPARTFGFVSEAHDLHRSGLALGASLSCAVVFDEHGLLNPEGLRFVDEPVRHKLLDALGDLGLLGAPVTGELLLSHCGHRQIHALLQQAIRSDALCPTG